MKSKETSPSEETRFVDKRDSRSIKSKQKQQDEQRKRDRAAKDEISDEKKL